MVILAVLLVGAAPFFARQIPSQSLKVGVDLVTINATVTGGYAFHGSARPFMGLDEAYKTIAVELKNEYVIGYRSTNLAKDGRWRKIQLKVNPPRGLSNLHVRSKTGYYAEGQTPSITK